MMTVELIFYIMLNMLVSDNIKPSYLADLKVQKHLYNVAEAIHDANGVDPHRLIALAFKETRFGYKPADLANGTACGVFQQVPSTALRKVTCEELVTDAHLAAEVAVLYIQYIDRRWGSREEDLSQRMCHYFSGNVCGDSLSQDYVIKYRKAYRNSKSWYRSMYCESDDEISDRFIMEHSQEILLNAMD